MSFSPKELKRNSIRPKIAFLNLFCHFARPSLPDPSNCRPARHECKARLPNMTPCSTHHQQGNSCLNLRCRSYGQHQILNRSPAAYAAGYQHQMPSRSSMHVLMM
eukprot:1160690-Pelagomonas_calceolata.AAC.6